MARLHHYREENVSGPKRSHKHKDLTFRIPRPNTRGLPEIMFCRILMSMWSSGLLNLRVPRLRILSSTGTGRGLLETVWKEVDMAVSTNCGGILFG